MTPAPRSRYVAIGSSFAAGPGIAPPASDRAKRARQSNRNYPHIVAERCGVDLIDVTSSGATVDDVLRTAQFGQPAQVTAVTAQTELVTVTVGGNDIGYIPSLFAAAMPTWLTRLPGVRGRMGASALLASAPNRSARITDGVGEVFAEIRRRAPSARVLCVDYLTVLPPTYRAHLPLDQPAFEAARDLAGDLNTSLAHAASLHNVDLVQASQRSVDHHAWAEDAWTTGWIWPRPGGAVAFHPTAAGMLAVSDMVAELIAA